MKGQKTSVNVEGPTYYIYVLRKTASCLRRSCLRQMRRRRQSGTAAGYRIK